MSSIKDKPLKKIVCDKRVTIDFLHINKINNINKNNDKINVLETKINKIKKNIDKTNIKQRIDTENKLLHLQNEYDSLNKDEYIEYYLDNGELLSDYYDNNQKIINNVNRSHKSVLDFMNKEGKEDKEIKTHKYDDMIKTYMVNTDDNYTYDTVLTNINMCKKCDGNLYMKYNNSEIVCEKCGFTEKILINLDSNSYKDPIRESTYFAYKRINHFNEWLAQFQAKETNDISEEIYVNIFKELNKNKNYSKDNISYKSVRNILKKLGYNKYYEHISHIINIITGKKSPSLDRHNEERLRYMFKEIQQPFQNNCPNDRKNFLSYAYVLHKFCELLELDHLLICFPLLKSREKLQQQDFIWKKICHDLKWEFIHSI
tara:strand:- start:1238 stop:2356 length:1119 start_codon:yes stop_codon:yes gene_type:complete